MMDDQEEGGDAKVDDHGVADEAVEDVVGLARVEDRAPDSQGREQSESLGDVDKEG